MSHPIGNEKNAKRKFFVTEKTVQTCKIVSLILHCQRLLDEAIWLFFRLLTWFVNVQRLGSDARNEINKGKSSILHKIIYAGVDIHADEVSLNCHILCVMWHRCTSICRKCQMKRKDKKGRQLWIKKNYCTCKSCCNRQLPCLCFVPRDATAAAALLLLTTQPGGREGSNRKGLALRWYFSLISQDMHNLKPIQADYSLELKYFFCISGIEEPSLNSSLGSHRFLGFTVLSLSPWHRSQ